MRRDPLQVLSRLRHLSVDEARRALAARLQDEGRAGAALRDASAELHRQAAISADLVRDAGWADAFATWLPRGQTTAQAARDALARAETATELARAGLGMARAQARATEELLARRAREKTLMLARKEQALLDEAGQRRRGRQ
jgi:flagellar export protein FliJ